MGSGFGRNGRLEIHHGHDCMSGDEVESCLTDQALLDKITAVAETGKKLGVDSTPTFFVNGKPYKGAMTIEQFSEILDPLLAAK